MLSADYLKDKVFSDREALWTVQLTQPKQNQLVLVAEFDGVFCGFICAFGANHPTFGTIIDNLHVKLANKGQGTGSRLLAAAASWALENYSAHDLYLEVLACNPKAMGFYQAKGAKNIATQYWHTPCDNQAKEYVFSWGSADNLLRGLA
ncbi:GNAT family N-acetyltransferase [Colwellia piezophila]|uniref:GNAT family N-acetyltransferase n=1 Tax=Colwellia piezophila TaxID=211668 RepID=UPI000373BB50|nr:GNAT family N-acetyltransferase [Colwellia piezophila]